MAVLTIESSWKRFGAILSATVTALLALPGLMLAQAQRMSADWLQLTPVDPKASLPSSEAPTSFVTASESGSTTVSIERRSANYRSKKDSVAGTTAYEASKRDQNLHIVVNLDDRKLMVVAGVDTVLEADIAVGSGAKLEGAGQAWKFDTPRGIRTVRGKDADPKWIPPEWHYVETAKEYGLEVVKLSMSKPYPISGGRKIMFQDGEAGVMDPDKGFMLLPLEEEIIFDGKLFVAPVESKNRKVQGALGKFKLDTGNGILFHGTPHQDSIGKAATHGCMRLRDADIEWLYQYVPVGTKIYIY